MIGKYSVRPTIVSRRITGAEGFVDRESASHSLEVLADLQQHRQARRVDEGDFAHVECDDVTGPWLSVDDPDEHAGDGQEIDLTTQAQT